jgi:trans-aconitate methyltransferase
MPDQPVTIADLARTWEHQQGGYIAARERRFDVMLAILELTVGDRPCTVIDLACGPGSLARRVADRLPAARVVAVDLDPVLLRLAAATLAPHGSRCRTLDADLTDPEWVGRLDGDRPDAVVSTTALHWLLPHQQVALHRQIAELLPPGGVFLDGDHQPFDDRAPSMRDLATRYQEAAGAAARAAGALTWDEWWTSAASVTELADEHAVREQRFAGRTGSEPTTIAFQLASLRQAGFSEATTAWQLFDDYVVFARR